MAGEVGSTRNGVCADCGVFFSRIRRTKLRCTECNAAHVRERGRLHAEKVRRANGRSMLGDVVSCRDCGCDYPKTGPKSYYCANCQEKRAAPQVGKVIQCAVCGCDVVKNSSRRVNCQPCSAELKRQRLAEKCKRTDHRADYLRRRDDRAARRATPEGRAKANASQAKRRQDPQKRLRDTISCYMRLSLKSGKRGASWERLVGYTIHDLKCHIEKLFLPGMSWENYGLYGWHVDHIRPVSSFNFETPHDPDFKACWALTNLQPLWAEDNLRKSGKVLTLL